MSDVYDSIARDPFLQKAREELDTLNTEIAALTRLSVQTIEDKVRKDALISRWGTLHSQYSGAIRTILNGATA